MLAKIVLFLTLAPPAHHRVVVEMNTGGTIAYGNAVNNVENLRKAFKGETTDIEIVCHGPGIDFLFSRNNSYADRIKKLQKDGVLFAACGNTLRNRKIAKDQIFSFVTVVDSGTAEVIRKQEAGWSYLHR